jgi:hypothetical protein
MPQRKKYSLLAILACLALIAGACGPSPNDREATIATSVAQTVIAQNSLVPPTSALTATPVILPARTGETPAGAPTSTASAQPRPTFPPASGGDAACAKASLVDETVPDGTIMKPGQQFTKTWKIKNDSSCTWDTSYKIVFWDGEVMGGGYVYNFPQQALPGDTVDVSLQLTAPMEDGNYQSYWKLQTPGGSSFGVGYDTAFWADIVVSSSEKVDYGVTAVTYSVERNPLSGCPTNVFYTISATITVNGPVSVTYGWRKSDGGTEPKQTLKFSEAGSKTVSFQWSLHLGAATNPRWAQLYTIEPVEQDYGKATFEYTCGQ